MSPNLNITFVEMLYYSPSRLIDDQGLRTMTKHIVPLSEAARKQLFNIGEAIDLEMQRDKQIMEGDSPLRSKQLVNRLLNQEGYDNPQTAIGDIDRLTRAFDHGSNLALSAAIDDLSGESKFTFVLLKEELRRAKTGLEKLTPQNGQAI